MENDHIALGNAVETIADTFLKLLGDEFRWELAFAKLPEEMIERLRAYGNEESFPADATLYTYGDRRTDMFVVLEGEVRSSFVQRRAMPKSMLATANTISPGNSISSPPRVQWSKHEPCFRAPFSAYHARNSSV